MSFKFRHLCDLLQALDDNTVRRKVRGEKASRSDTSIIISWFEKHDQQIPRHGDAAMAFLSCIFPERRPDRMYHTQEKRLEKIVGRSLALGVTRLTRLSAWRSGDGAEFAQIVQNVMSEAEFDRPRPANEVTLEEIDSIFDRIAAWCKGSSPELRERIRDPMTADQGLSGILRRLQSMEAKWLLRMFLKSYSPVVLPEYPVLRQYHYLMFDALRFQNCFRAALSLLDHPEIARLCPRLLGQPHERSTKVKAATYLRPQIGIMIQRAPYNKARNLQHCCDLAARRRISVERKYDGEYCQVHINLSRKDPIQIFSKSGKDSTEDRVRLLGVIEKALKLKGKDCLIKKQCILEGELLIWHEKHQRIEPFEKIRKHVTRNGRWVGVEQDSPRDLHEKPMIMFYDLMLLDDIICLNELLEQRRSRLRSLLCRLPGQVDIGYRQKINFASSDAKALLRRAFAKSITSGWEGFVLKGCDDPYFSLAGAPRCIKVKKDYFPGLGNVVDLAIIGGQKDKRNGNRIDVSEFRWTVFYLACLENGQQVHRFAEKPRFRVVGTVNPAKMTVSHPNTQLLNQLGQFETVPYHPKGVELEVIIDLKLDPPTVLFKKPFVVEAVGSGFEKPQGVAYHTLRFPRITKIHEDRSWNEITSFDDLQKAAAESMSMLGNKDSREDAQWIRRLVQADPRSKFVDGYSPGNSGAGKSNSGTNASTVSSTARQSQVSPILVRIDTQELPDAERREQVRSPNTGPCSLSTSPTMRKNLLKRGHKPPNLDLEASPSNKRVRVSPPHIGTSDNNNTSPRRDSSPPSCDSPYRQALFEDRSTALTAELSTPSLIPSPRVRQEPDQEADHSADADLREANLPPTAILKGRATAMVALPSNSPIRQVLQELPLPTPPNSSRQECQDEVGTSVEHVPKQGVLSNQISPPAGVVPQEVTEAGCWSSKNCLNVLPQCSSMILFSPNTLARFRSQECNLVSNLITLNVSFTFSRELFLNSFQNPAAAPQTHIAIISAAHHADTGAEIADLHDLISDRLDRNGADDGSGSSAIERGGQVIFFDWQMLRSLPPYPLTTTGKEGGATSIASLRQHFAGCLAWCNPLHRQECSTAGSQSPVLGPAPGSSQCQIKAVWDWDAVVELAIRA